MNQRYLKRTIVKHTIESEYLEENREILVYLPPDYDRELTYPALYLQDGDDYLNMGRIATQCNRLILENELHPILIIAVPVDKSRRTAEYHPSGKRHPNYLRFFIHELLPEIEANFPIEGSTESRVVGGSSLGGTVSLHLALNYPEHFRRVLSQSGAFLKTTSDQIGHADSLAHLTVYQSIGLSETAVPTHFGKIDLVARNREVHHHLQKKRAIVHYKEKDGNHTWGFWQKDLPEALKTFFAKK